MLTKLLPVLAKITCLLCYFLTSVIFFASCNSQLSLSATFSQKLSFIYLFPTNPLCVTIEILVCALKLFYLDFSCLFLDLLCFIPFYSLQIFHKSSKPRFSAYWIHFTTYFFRSMYNSKSQTQNLSWSQLTISVKSQRAKAHLSFQKIGIEVL